MVMIVIIVAAVLVVGMVSEDVSVLFSAGSANDASALFTGRVSAAVSVSDNFSSMSLTRFVSVFEKEKMIKNNNAMPKKLYQYIIRLIRPLSENN